MNIELKGNVKNQAKISIGKEDMIFRNNLVIWAYSTPSYKRDKTVKLWYSKIDSKVNLTVSAGYPEIGF